MAKICLIGDSIRMCYQGMVTNLLKDNLDIDVYYDEYDNGRFVQYNLWQYNQLVRKYGEFDLVFFNSGYWDMNIEAPMKEALNPVSIYLEGLKRLANLIKETSAIPIFINTIPIYEDGASLDNTGTNAQINYKNEWVIEYNKAAEDLMKSLNIEIIDAYSLMLKGNKYYKCEDMLHLTNEGSLVLAKAIVKKAKELLIF